MMERENGNDYSMLGLYWDNGNKMETTSVYWGNGKENGNDYNMYSWLGQELMSSSALRSGAQCRVAVSKKVQGLTGSHLGYRF